MSITNHLCNKDIPSTTDLLIKYNKLLKDEKYIKKTFRMLESDLIKDIINISNLTNNDIERLSNSELSGQGKGSNSVYQLLIRKLRRDMIPILNTHPTDRNNLLSEISSIVLSTFLDIACTIPAIINTLNNSSSVTNIDSISKNIIDKFTTEMKTDIIELSKNTNSLENKNKISTDEVYSDDDDEDYSEEDEDEYEEEDEDEDEDEKYCKKEKNGGKNKTYMDNEDHEYFDEADELYGKFQLRFWDLSKKLRHTIALHHGYASCNEFLKMNPGYEFYPVGYIENWFERDTMFPKMSLSSQTS